MLRTVLAPQDEDAPPFVFLLHGEGGMGKSQLTRRLRDIALQEAPFESALHALWTGQWSATTPSPCTSPAT
ncbi:MAG: ATP-binding protein [Delftia sp.]|nr:ATP-binding protein [Delftia sp.]